MEVEITTATPHRARLTLEARELYLLKVALERACYMDTDPDDQNAALAFAEELLRALRGEGG